MTQMKTKPASEEQMVQIVRNALLVAGQEMGDGDQWPVIKDTIYKIAKDYEELKVERNVDAELKIHLYAQLREMDEELARCSPEIQAQVGPKFRELREVCDAHFSDLDRTAIVYDPDQAPEHMKRMKAIISTLENDNE